MPFKSVNGLSMHYQWLDAESTANQNQAPVVLLAGMASDGASWQPVIQGLRSCHTLIVPDNRCSGKTTPNPIATDRASMVTDVLTLMDSLDVERFHIVGHSMGGMLGWAIACAAPQRVTHLVAAAAQPSILPARISLFNSLAALRNEQTEDQWFRLLYQFLFKAEFFHDEAVVKSAVAASQAYPYKQGITAFSHQVAGLSSFLQSPDLAAIRCPVTLLTGSHDILMTPEMLVQCKQAYGNVSTHIINQAAHALHWEQPEAFVHCVLAALDHNR